MKKELKKKVYVTVIDGMIAIAAKGVLSEEQFKKASDNKERVEHMLRGTNVDLWFIDESKQPYNLGIRSLVTGSTTSEAIAKEEERMKEMLDQLIEQINKLPENKPAENKTEETEETQDVPADDHEEFLKALTKDIEDSLKQHFGEDVKYAFFARSGNSICVDSTIHPLDVIHMMAYAAENQ